MKFITKICVVIALVSVLSSCTGGKGKVSSVLESSSITSSANTVSSSPIYDITKKQFPIIQSTEFTQMFSQGVIDRFFISESERASMPPTSEKDLNSRLKSDEIDVAFIESFNNNISFDVELEYVLIGTDATVFLTSKDNPVSQLSINQLKNIYISRDIKNWSQIGGKPGEIFLPEYSDKTCLVRLQNLLQDAKSPLFNITQGDLYSKINFDFSIPMSSYSLDDNFTLFCTSAHSAANTFSHPEIYKGASLERTIFIDGKKPTVDNILSGEYPYLSRVYAVTKKSTPNNPYTKQLVEWICTSEANDLKVNTGVGIMDKSSKINLDALTKIN